MGGASGFDFTDIVANNSGIRMSDRMMRTAHEEWPALLRLVGHEEDVIAPIEGIPTAMTRDQFAAGFGSLESPEYAAMLDRIEARIDALPLHLAGL